MKKTVEERVNGVLTKLSATKKPVVGTKKQVAPTKKPVDANKKPKVVKPPVAPEKLMLNGAMDKVKNNKGAIAAGAGGLALAAGAGYAAGKGKEKTAEERVKKTLEKLALSPATAANIAAAALIGLPIAGLVGAGVSGAMQDKNTPISSAAGKGALMGAAGAVPLSVVGGLGLPAVMSFSDALRRTNPMHPQHALPPMSNKALLAGGLIGAGVPLITGAGAGAVMGAGSAGIRRLFSSNSEKTAEERVSRTLAKLAACGKAAPKKVKPMKKTAEERVHEVLDKLAGRGGGVIRSLGPTAGRRPVAPTQPGILTGNKTPDYTANTSKTVADAPATPGLNAARGRTNRPANSVGKSPAAPGASGPINPWALGAGALAVGGGAGYLAGRMGNNQG